MKDVEFEEDEELTTLAIPKREDTVPDSIMAKELVKRNLVPTGLHANYVLIGISILLFALSLFFFALYVQTPEKSQYVAPTIVHVSTSTP